MNIQAQQLTSDEKRAAWKQQQRSILSELSTVRNRLHESRPCVFQQARLSLMMAKLAELQTMMEFTY